MISRRVALKQMALLSAGVTIAASCLRNRGEVSKLYKNIRVTEDQEKLIASIADTLLPKSETPGATDVSAAEFTAKMVDDCLSRQDQAKWLSGMNRFFELTAAENSASFDKWNRADREKFLSAFEEKKVEDRDASFFYRTVRRFSLQAYTSSEYFMTSIQNYKMLPGPFRGCVAMNNPS